MDISLDKDNTKPTKNLLDQTTKLICDSNLIWNVGVVGDISKMLTEKY